jgi:hypothetical protein
MLANTGTVSFVIYGIFILITVASMVISFILIKKGTLETEKLDKMIELFKYAVVSVAIATTTLVISDLFKEREQDVKELEYFDKYAQDMKKVDGIQERYQLSKYLAIVAPNGEMKKSWSEYHDTIRTEYKKYLELKKEEIKLSAIPSPTSAQIVKQEEISSKIMLQESPLVSFQKTNVTKRDPRLAKMHEEMGYEFLLKKEIENAIIAFTKSENAYNGFHQAYEIANLLKLSKSGLNNGKSSEGWQNLYKEILNRYSLYASSSIKKQLMQNSK